jgi:hypothetical protein
MAKSESSKLQGTCSVCLRSMQLHGDHPIRHGFSAVGVRHGQHGGFHTGPCSGTSFPHLGISTEGTQWARARARDQLVATEQRLADLAGNPDLTWYPRLSGSYNKVRGGLPDTSRPVTLRPGEDVPYAGDGRPTYAHEHRRLVSEQTSIKHSLESAIAEYARVLASWSPEKYPVTGAAKKVETEHMATPRKNIRGEWTGVLCRFTKSGYASDRLPKTDDPSKVTCKRCRAALGLPA